MSNRIDSDATGSGWRVVNFLAIASPYLVAAALFVTLYFTREPVRPSSGGVGIAAAPEAFASGPSVAVFGNGQDAAAPAAEEPKQSADTAPQAKHDALPAPVHPPAQKPASTQDTASTHPPAEKPVSIQDTAQNHPVAVDPAVAATMKLSGAPPIYPAIARAAGVQGTVVVALTIAPDGSVSDAHAASGPPLLQAATISAVRMWRYRPYLVFGKAAPFETQVSINFELSSSPPQPQGSRP